MERKFTTPVSMACTKEQFEDDLKGQVFALGYVAANNCFVPEKDYNHLCSNCDNIDNKLVFLPKDNCQKRNRHFIPEYNPSLFLALAGMSEGDDVHVGEWGHAKGLPGLSEVVLVDFVNKLYSARNNNVVYNQIDLPLFRKATKEEIIAHFTKQEQPKPEEKRYFNLTQIVFCEDDRDCSDLKAGELYQVRTLDDLHIGFDITKPPMYLKDRFRLATDQEQISFNKTRKGQPEELKPVVGEYYSPKKTAVGFADQRAWKVSEVQQFQVRLVNAFDVEIVLSNKYFQNSFEHCPDPLWDEILNHKETETSQVNHPSHYGGDEPYEVIKVIEAWGFQNNAYRFNAIKYLARADKKGTLKQDLEKAIWYIQRELSKLNEQ